MALISCPECGHEVSDTAKTCANCGYRIRQHKAISKKTICALAVLLIVVAVAGISIAHRNKIEHERELALIEAREASEKADELYALSMSYLELGRAVEAGTGSKPDFLAIQYEILDFLKLNHDMADLTGVNDDIVQAIQDQMDIYIATAVDGKEISKENTVRNRR